MLTRLDVNELLPRDLAAFDGISPDTAKRLAARIRSNPAQEEADIARLLTSLKVPRSKITSFLRMVGPGNESEEVVDTFDADYLTGGQPSVDPLLASVRLNPDGNLAALSSGRVLLTLSAFLGAVGFMMQDPGMGVLAQDRKRKKAKDKLIERLNKTVGQVSADRKLNVDQIQKASDKINDAIRALEQCTLTGATSATTTLVGVGNDKIYSAYSDDLLIVSTAALLIAFKHKWDDENANNVASKDRPTFEYDAKNNRLVVKAGGNQAGSFPVKKGSKPKAASARKLAKQLNTLFAACDFPDLVLAEAVRRLRA